MPVVLREVTLLCLEVSLHVGTVSDGSVEVALVHLLSSPKPSAERLHLGVLTSILDESHCEDLTLYIIVEELISLDQQVILDRLVLSQGITAVGNLLSRVDAKSHQLVVRQFPKLSGKLLWSVLPLFESSLEVAFHIVGVVLHLVALVFDELSHSNVLLPSIPNLWDNLLVWILSHSHSSEVLVHEIFVFTEPILALNLDF